VSVNACDSENQLAKRALTTNAKTLASEICIPRDEKHQRMQQQEQRKKDKEGGSSSKKMATAAKAKAKRGKKKAQKEASDSG
ncbi:unnamed protein product, partial [Prorocentrum cordatum]